jgi:hypothetical protein
VGVPAETEITAATAHSRLVSTWTARCRWLLLAAGTTAVIVTLQPLTAAAGDREPPGPRPFQPVLQTRLRGDLLMAGNANVVSTGLRRGATSIADGDDDRSFLCVDRPRGDATCADNSSAAVIDLPARARVVHARLYVETSLTATAGAMRVRLDVPGRSFSYAEIGADTPAVPKLYEAVGFGRDGSRVRQAVWDVTHAVAAGGAGTYTVADIVSERTGTSSPHASWAIVLAYELRPTRELTDLRPVLRRRFAERMVSWHDGFVVLSDRSMRIPIRGLEGVAGQAAFAKSFHLVAQPRHGASDNLLLNGRPLGNNLTPGDRAAPPGVALGRDQSCNSITGIFNGTKCVLGTPARPRWGARSVVDMDVVRIPDGYLSAGGDTAVISLRTAGGGSLAPGMVAMSIDVGAGQ